MALDALCNRNTFIIFPVIVRMDVRVALGTRHPFFSMHTGIVFGILFFVASLTLNLLDLDLFSHMLGKIGYVHMATGAGIFAMH